MGELVAEVRRALVAAISLLVAALAVVWAAPSARAEDSLEWRKTEWRFHPPEGFPQSEKYERDAFVPLANGWVAVLGQLDSTSDGFVQVHDGTGRWLWTTLLSGEDGIVGYWSWPAAVAVRSKSGAWDLVASENEGYYIWRIDAQGGLLWRRMLESDIGLDLAPAMAAENDAVWLGGWAATDDMCGEGAAVVKLDEAGNAVWRWRQPEPKFGAVNDLLPLGDGRLLVWVDYGGPLAHLGSMSAVCPRTSESELVLLDADGKELARRMLPFDPGIGAMVRLADGRVALTVEREQGNRLFIAVIDVRDGISVSEVSLDPALSDAGYFGNLPVIADEGGGLMFYAGNVIYWVAPTGKITRTTAISPVDMWTCRFRSPSSVVCLDYYLLNWLEIR
jgi:hypothetical protein